MPAPKMPWLPSFLCLLLLPMAVSIPSAGADGRADAGQGSTGLYLADGGKLVTSPGGDGSAPFPPQAKLSIGLVWLVGTWSSEPLAASMNYAGSINFSLWAKASSAGQLSTRFQVYFGTNGARGPTAYSTNSDRLGSSPKELKGTASSVTLKANAGDTITFMVYVSERGSGGELVYGSSCPSGFKLGFQALKLNVTYESKPGALMVTGTITDVWGSQDIDEVAIVVIRSAPQTLNQTGNMTGSVKVIILGSTDLETDNNETVFTYTWNYDAKTIRAGTYYVIVMVTTYSNSTAMSMFSVQLGPAAGGGISGTVVLVAGAIVIALAAVGAFYYLKKSGRLKHPSPAAG